LLAKCYCRYLNPFASLPGLLKASGYIIYSGYFKDYIEDYSFFPEPVAKAVTQLQLNDRPYVGEFYTVLNYKHRLCYVFYRAKPYELTKYSRSRPYDFKYMIEQENHCYYIDKYFILWSDKFKCWTTPLTRYPEFYDQVPAGRMLSYDYKMHLFSQPLSVLSSLISSMTDTINMHWVSEYEEPYANDLFLSDSQLSSAYDLSRLMEELYTCIIARERLSKKMTDLRIEDAEAFFDDQFDQAWSKLNIKSTSLYHRSRIL